MRVTPNTFLNVSSCMLESMHIAVADTIMKVVSIGIILFHEMYLLNFHAIITDVVRANSPDRVVASPYDGIRKGSIVMMNMPNPNPVVRCTKLAPTVSRNISRIFSIISLRTGCSMVQGNAFRIP